jgi:putative FmdB family regulatory protein
MPISEYWCRTCAAAFDKLQPMGASGTDETTCPRCGASAKKMLSLVATVNRGSSSEAGPQYQSGGGGGCGCGGQCGCGGHH